MESKKNVTIPIFIYSVIILAGVILYINHLTKDKVTKANQGSATEATEAQGTTQINEPTDAGQLLKTYTIYAYKTIGDNNFEKETVQLIREHPGTESEIIGEPIIKNLHQNQNSHKIITEGIWEARSRGAAYVYIEVQVSNESKGIGLGISQSQLQ